MADGRFVAYYRVSTDKQGVSRLGLEAQQKAVLDYLNGGAHELLETFTEVESGKRKNRPQLDAALAYCRKHKATLVIAKLDRLARNVHFVSGLMEAGVDFVAADMPSANRLTIHILAAVAEAEAEAISARTKAALAAAKARGTQLGRHGKVLAAENRQAADAHALTIAPQVGDLLKQGLTIRDLTDELNARGVPTLREGRWHVASVHRLVKRLQRLPNATEATHDRNHRHHTQGA